MSERDWGKCICCEGRGYVYILRNPVPDDGSKLEKECCECGGTGFNGLLDPHNLKDNESK